MNRFMSTITFVALADSCFAQAAVTAYPATTVITTITTSTVTGPGAAPVVETTSTTTAFPVAGAHVAAGPVAAATTQAQPAAGAIAIASITKAQTGEFVTIEGTIADYRASRGERAPHSFFVKNGADTMRVCIWPDVFEKIVGKEKLAAPGGRVKLTAEVSEYNDKVELHLGDPTEIKF